MNTGWNGSGERISIRETRRIINAILNGSLDGCETRTLLVFGLAVPTRVDGISSARLDPRSSYPDEAVWNKRAQTLAGFFVENFTRYTDTAEGERLIKAGPQWKI